MAAMRVSRDIAATITINSKINDAAISRFRSGEEFSARSAAPILQLYMLTGILRPMQNQAANLLNSIGKQALCFVINTISLAANLIINYTCFRLIGFYGAAIGTLITCALGTLAWYLIMRKQIGTKLSSIIVYMMESYKTIYLNLWNMLAKTKKANT